MITLEKRDDYMKVFLIGGKAGVGKGSAAQIIKEYYAKQEKETVITQITKYIKMYAMEISNWNGEEENKPRALLQMVGSKIREELGEKFFVRRIVEDLSFYKLNYEVVVIADIRLPFEIEYFREILGDMVYALKITRKKNPTELKESEKSHETEIALDHYHGFDYEFKNNEDLDTFKAKIMKYLERIDSK